MFILELGEAELGEARELGVFFQKKGTVYEARSMEGI
jgi:hypothetical protein